MFLFVGFFGVHGGEVKADVVDSNVTNIWLIGDSTVASGSGWGDFLPDFVPDISVNNKAQGGQSSKSYYEAADNLNGWRGNANSVMSNISDGDYVFIQFGHLDQSTTPYKHTTPGDAPDYLGTYRTYLEYYINETREAGGIPLLITSVSTMYFSADGSHIRNHGDYPAAMLRVGLDNSVQVLDLEQRSSELFNSLGEAETLSRFGGFNAHLGLDDRTHFLPEKAPGITQLVADLLQETNDPELNHIPVPAAVWLFGTALMGLGGFKKTRFYSKNG
jgi:hypothetical protein